MKKISFKIIIFISNKKQSKMPFSITKIKRDVPITPNPTMDDLDVVEVVDFLYDILCESSFYESHRETVRRKDTTKLVEMFREFYEKIEKHDHELLVSFKEVYNTYYFVDYSHTYKGTDSEGAEAYTKWNTEVNKIREYQKEIVTYVIVQLYRKLYANL